MNKYIHFVAKKRKALIVLLLLICILALIGISKLNVNAKFDIFKVDHSQYQSIMDEMNGVFDSSNQVLLVVEVNTLEKDSSSITEVLESEALIYHSPLDMSKLQNIEGIDTSDKMPMPTLDDQDYLTFFIDLKEDYDFDELIDKLNNTDLEYYLSGEAYMQYEIVSLILGVLAFIPPLALGLILLTFRSQLASFKAAFLSVLPAGLAAMWTVGLIGWLGSEVSIITVLAPIFAIVIGSADGLHFVTHMEEELSLKSPIDALTHTLSIVGMPMIITTTTSIAGFLGLMFIDAASIKSLALFASVGVFFAGLITWYVLPLIFTSNIKLNYKVSKHAKHKLLKLWGKKSLIIASVLVIISITFLPNIKSEFNQLMFFRDFTTVQKSFNKIVEVNDGAIPLYYYGQSDSENFKEDAQIANNILTDLSQLDTVKKVVNPLSLLNSQAITPENLGKFSELIKFKDGEIYYRFMIYPSDLDNDTIQAIEDEVNGYTSNIQAGIIGSQLLMKEMNESLVKGQILSIASTFTMIFIMLLFTLKSLRLTLISSLPIIITSIILYGFLGMTGISLNLMTCTIFSITLGIGVDYAIHYTSTYKYYRDQGDPTPKLTAFKYSSRPVIANAFGLSLGLSALWLSPLLIHLHISTLMWVSMIIAVFTSLTVLPTLLPNK